MRVEVLRAWPRRFDLVEVQLPDVATARDAVIAAGWGDDAEAVAYAVFGQRVEGDTLLRDGDRLEMLRPLLADPKEARRQRVEERRRSPGK
jgi:hypothetical protein